MGRGLGIGGKKLIIENGFAVRWKGDEHAVGLCGPYTDM